MKLNSLIFPAPAPSYTETNLDGLLYIPTTTKVVEKPSSFQIPFFCLSCEDRERPREVEHWIPCMYLRYNEGSTKILIYFHGNAEDIGQAYDFLTTLKMELRCHVLAVEYPGYGLYEGIPSSERIASDALGVYDFLSKTLRWNERDILLLGRSMGSGPSTYVAARRNPGALILISPYTSIRNVVKDIAGSMLQYLVEDRFNNIDEIKFVTSPTMLIHGKSDELIPCQHSVDLMAKCRGMCYIKIPEAMTHNSYNIFDDIIGPVKKFFMDAGVGIDNMPQVSFFPRFPPFVYSKSKQKAWLDGPRKSH